MSTMREQLRAATRKAAERNRSHAAYEATVIELADDPHGVDEGNLRGADQDVAAAQATPRVEEDNWSRPHDLDAPPPRPGMTQRWIRVRIGSDKDPKNSNRKFREGWQPRPADTVPRGYTPPTMVHGSWGEVIGVEDLILCEMPIRKAKQRNAFYDAKKERMEAGLTDDLRNVDKHGPRIKRLERQRVTMRRAKVPTDPGVADNE